jgi:RimJ/RimL family protein N-acetyltransferase
MIELRPTRIDELALLVQLETAPGSREFIIPNVFDAHRANLAHEDFVYLSILERQAVVGVIILRLDAEPNSVEFRRIVVRDRNRGIGQQAIRTMEAWCRSLGRSRIWLDVFESNQRARHLYEKLGYRQFGQSTFEGKVLLLYEHDLG